MKRSMPTALPTVACVAAIAACNGSLSGSTDKPSVLATIHGTVVASQSVSLGSTPLAVAILWAKALPGSTRVMSTSVAVKPTFPSSFSLDFTDVPPDSVMFDIANIECGGPPCDKPDAAPLHIPIALGVLVVYEDVNRNGKLDLVAPGAPAYVDKIVGESTVIVYTEQPLPQDQNYFSIPGIDGSVLKAGYNWDRVHRWDCEPGDGGFNPLQAERLVPVDRHADHPPDVRTSRGANLSRHPHVFGSPAQRGWDAGGNGWTGVRVVAVDPGVPGHLRGPAPVERRSRAPLR